MVMGVILGLMVVCMRDSGLGENSMVLAFTQLAVAKESMVCGRMESELNGLTKIKLNRSKRVHLITKHFSGSQKAGST